MSFSDAYNKLIDFKTIFKSYRANRSSARGLDIYPPNPCDFMRQCPDRYSADDPPVKCPLPGSTISSGRYLVSCRIHNNKLKQDERSMLKKTIMAAPQSSGSIVDYGRAFQEGVNSARSLLGNRSLRRQSPSDAFENPPKRQAITNTDDQTKATVAPRRQKNFQKTMVMMTMTRSQLKPS